MNQSSESLCLVDEWDQADFDELHPSLKGGSTNNNNTNIDQKVTKKQNNNNNFALIESRYLMHDLIKITSRKSSAKIITFYFRIPVFEEYITFDLESNLI